MLTSLAFVFLTGLGLGWLAARLRLPGLLGILLAGIVLGPVSYTHLDEYKRQR